MEKKIRTKEKILQASIQLFNQMGERAVTTNHIAAHLGISPGNLYYHYRNKEDIVRQIFHEYARLLDERLKTPSAQLSSVEALAQYLDVVFEVMWRFNFLYANLPDILARNEALQQDYLTLQKNVLQRVIALIHALKDEGYLDIEVAEIAHFAHTVRLVVTFWISYLKAQAPETEIDQAHAWQGVLKVLALFKPYATELALPKIKQLQAQYQQLAGQPLLN